MPFFLRLTFGMPYYEVRMAETQREGSCALFCQKWRGDGASKVWQDVEDVYIVSLLIP